MHQVDKQRGAHEVVIVAELLAPQSEPGSQADRVGGKYGKGERYPEDRCCELFGLERVC